jgi:hypothetical protein
MLSWFRKRLETFWKPAAPVRAGPVGVRVRFDDTTISLSEREGRESRLDWSEIAAVTVITSDAGPIENDLYWVLHGRDRARTLVVPMGAEGEHELLHAMQERLQGFDNMTVIEAMGSTGNASFTVWEPAPAVRRPVT